MLSKRYRLKDPPLFAATLQRGQSLVNCPYYRVLTLPLARARALPSTPQIGFIISKKVHKRAVVRNRLKRQLRHAFRPYLQALVPPLTEVGVMVCIVKSAAVGCSFDQLNQPLVKAFGRL